MSRTGLKVEEEEPATVRKQEKRDGGGGVTRRFIRNTGGSRNRSSRHLRCYHPEPMGVSVVKPMAEPVVESVVEPMYTFVCI